MASSTKYTPAPQRDSFEDEPQSFQASNTKYTPAPPRDEDYSQPPPSYQAEPLMGEARSEDDNVPDDFKV